jgi:succinyl-diaminopimelate desuccinylase
VLTADDRAADAPTIVSTATSTSSPAAEQFTPRVEGDRLIGRGAYDMKGALAAMMCALHDVAAERACACASCARPTRSPRTRRPLDDEMVRSGFVGDFAITGEPTDLHVGVQAKGVLACRIVVSGRAAHGSTPWLGDNAVLKAIDVFRRIETCRSRASPPSCSTARRSTSAGSRRDALNKVPDECTMVVDIRYLPNQDPGDILEQIRTIPDIEIPRTFIRKPAYVLALEPVRDGALRRRLAA